jgi:hypothetical protein
MPEAVTRKKTNKRPPDACEIYNNYEYIAPLSLVNQIQQFFVDFKSLLAQLRERSIVADYHVSLLTLSILGNLASHPLARLLPAHAELAQTLDLKLLPRLNNDYEVQLFLKPPGKYQSGIDYYDVHCSTATERPNLASNLPQQVWMYDSVERLHFYRIGKDHPCEPLSSQITRRGNYFGTEFTPQTIKNLGIAFDNILTYLIAGDYPGSSL